MLLLATKYPNTNYTTVQLNLIVKLTKPIQFKALSLKSLQLANYLAN